MMKIDQAGDDAANNNDVACRSRRRPDPHRRNGQELWRDAAHAAFLRGQGAAHPQRDGSTRLYTRRDVARLKLILLGRKVGFSLREVKQMLDLYDPKGSNTKQLR